MYNTFFGFDSDPFRVNPDPRFLYLSEGHREALATLLYAVRERKGFVALTGEVGTGKTTVLNAMLRELDPATETAYIFNTALTVEDFFECVFSEFDLEPVEPFRKAKALGRLNDFLIERLKDGKQTLLVIDEAQNLSHELLEEIRMLSNLETPQSKLIQIILVGQPEFAHMLGQPQLRQLRQRVELRQVIQPLAPEETHAYVCDRMLVAGHESGDIFTRAALRAVHLFSGGIPRVINVLCDNALLSAYAKQSRRVAAQMVHEAAHALDLSVAAKPAERKAAVPVTRTREEGWLRKVFASRRPAAPQLGA